MTTNDADLKNVWQPIFDQIGGYSLASLFSTWSSLSDRIAMTKSALQSVYYRGSALNLILIMPEDIAQQFFEDLVELASVGHCDILLCRRAIKSMSRKWLLSNIEGEVNKVLDLNPDDDECFRRFAELYADIDERLLPSLLRRAAESSNPHIREVADDFRQ